MAGTNWILLLLIVLSAWMCAVSGLQETSTTSHTAASSCSDAEVYLKQDWGPFTSCCEALYPNGTCPIACPCRNGAECFPNNRTCLCKPGWVGALCQRSCRERSSNTYGVGCKRGCRCGPDASCEPITGVCECRSRENCTARCPRNRFGPKCRKKCRCKTGGCDQVTGVCNVADASPLNCGCLNGGACRSDGKPCRCTAAWTGRLCDVPCPPGFYGEDCSTPCDCGGNATCSRTTGLCECAAEDKYSCAGRCPAGLYGPRCSYLCKCPTGLVCNQWNGDCGCESNDCREIHLGNTTDSSTTTVTTPASTQPMRLVTNATTTATISPSISFHSSTPSSSSSSSVLQHHSSQETMATDASGSTTRPAAEKRSVRPAAADDDLLPIAGGSSTKRLDEDALSGGNGFYPTAPFWVVVGAIAVLLIVVVVLLLLILRRQMSSRSALTRQPKIGRQDNVYETVEEIAKDTATQQEAKKTPPPLPDMFQRGGNRSSVHSYHHRPLSVHSPLPAMDTPLPASVAAMVCSSYGGAPPVPGGTSRRSLMAEWRPHGQLESAMDRAKSRSHSSLFDEPQTPDRGGKAMSCIYNGGITIEDDYADPFDSISPTCNAGNRPPGYLPMLLGQDRGRAPSPTQRCNSPVSLRGGGSPMTVQRSGSPMNFQRCGSPMSVQRSPSPANVQRTVSPITAHQSEPNLNLHQSDPNMNVHPKSNSPLGIRRGTASSSSLSPQRQSGSQVIDPFYFTLEQQGNPSGVRGPEDDYDEVEPHSPINSPFVGVSMDNRPASRTPSEHSRASSGASSQGSMSANSPTPVSSFGSSPQDAEMFAVDRRPEASRPSVPQRPLSSNVYESCGPQMKSTTPLDDGIYSRLNRYPSQLPMSPRVADLNESAYGRLQRSYSAKAPARSTDAYDGPYGKLPQRSRSAMVKSQQMGGSSADCVASEWVPADPRPRLPPRGTKPPLVTEPRKKFRWSIKGKLTKKSSTEEVENDGPTSAATLPYSTDWKGL